MKVLRLNTLGRFKMGHFEKEERYLMLKDEFQSLTEVIRVFKIYDVDLNDDVLKILAFKETMFY